jgi:hypothetical protein
MKTILQLLLVSVIFFSCKKEEFEKPVSKSFNTAGATLKYQANFVSNVHSTSGSVNVYEENNVRTLVFKNFKTDSGPALRVYLAKGTNISSFVSLGNLISLEGDFFYTLDGSIKIAEFPYVLIWCEQYSVLFGNAKLE